MPLAVGRQRSVTRRLLGATGAMAALGRRHERRWRVKEDKEWRLSVSITNVPQQTLLTSEEGSRGRSVLMLGLCCVERLRQLALDRDINKATPRPNGSKVDCSADDSHHRGSGNSGFVKDFVWVGKAIGWRVQGNLNRHVGNPIRAKTGRAQGMPSCSGPIRARQSPSEPRQGQPCPPWHRPFCMPSSAMAKLYCGNSSPHVCHRADFGQS
jgi:hypothetical protein